MKQTYFSDLKVLIKATGIVIVGGLFAAPIMANSMYASGQLSGDYIIQQKNSQSYLTAHQGSKWKSVVTRNFQCNAKRVWTFNHVAGDDYTIQQKSDGSYMDANIETNNSFSVMTFDKQNDDSLVWQITETPNGGKIIKQKISGRFLDSYEEMGDNLVVTGDQHHNDAQVWVLTPFALFGCPLIKKTQRLISKSRLIERKLELSGR